MADTSVAITAGTGTPIDVRTEATNGNYRQVVVLGDPSTNAGVAPVDATNGLSVNVTNIAGGNVADNGADSGNPVKVGGKYNASAPTYADGDRADLQTTVNGFLKVSNADLAGGEDLTNNTQGTTPKVIVASTYSPSTSINFGAATKANVKASAGTVVSCSAYNDNAAPRFFQLHNKASAPAAAEVPIISVPVLQDTHLVLGTEFFTNAGKYFSTGVGWAWSTTAGTFTDSATASDHNTVINYF
jgi:hypothetical protein